MRERERKRKTDGRKKWGKRDTYKLRGAILSLSTRDSSPLLSSTRSFNSIFFLPSSFSTFFSFTFPDKQQNHSLLRSFLSDRLILFSLVSSFSLILSQSSSSRLPIFSFFFMWCSSRRRADTFETHTHLTHGFSLKVTIKWERKREISFPQKVISFLVFSSHFFLLLSFSHSSFSLSPSFLGFVSITTQQIYEP